MKKLRKNIDLDAKTILVLQMEATAHGFGTLKPYLENILAEKALKAVKENSQFYERLVDNDRKNGKLQQQSKKHKR